MAAASDAKRSFPERALEDAKKIPLCESLNYHTAMILPGYEHYSLMPRFVSSQHRAIRFNTSPPVKTIIDACGGMGMDTRLLRLLFPSAAITVFETDPEAYKYLAANVAGVNTVLGSVLDRKVTEKVDLIYFDPPWTEAYHIAGLDELVLKFAGRSLADVISQFRKETKTLILKLPWNIQFDSFKSVGSFKQVNISDVKGKLGYYLLIYEGQ